MNSSSSTAPLPLKSITVSILSRIGWPQSRPNRGMSAPAMKRSVFHVRWHHKVNQISNGECKKRSNTFVNLGSRSFAICHGLELACVFIEVLEFHCEKEYIVTRKWWYSACKCQDPAQILTTSAYSATGLLRPPPILFCQLMNNWAELTEFWHWLEMVSVNIRDFVCDRSAAEIQRAFDTLYRAAVFQLFFHVFPCFLVAQSRRQILQS